VKMLASSLRLMQRCKAICLARTTLFVGSAIQLEKGYIYQGSLRDGAAQDLRRFAVQQSGPLSLDGVMMQIDCYDLDFAPCPGSSRDYLTLAFFRPLFHGR